MVNIKGMVQIYHKEFKIIGRKIAYYRTLKHFSQAQLAEVVGISAGYLSKIERADLDSISLGTLILIAKGLNIPVHVLTNFDEAGLIFKKGESEN